MDKKNATPVCTRHPARGRRRAFTLIELLTVIAIVSVLSALLIPVTRGAIERAIEAETASHLRSCHLAAVNFAQANDDAIVLAYSVTRDGYGRTRGTWMNQLFWSNGDFIGIAKNTAGVADTTIITRTEIFGCRRQLSMHDITDTKVSFGINSRVGNWAAGVSPVGAKRMGEVVFPARTLLFMHGVYRSGSASPFANNVNESYANVAEPVFGDEVMGVFFDGHVDMMALSDIPSDIATDKGKYFWLGCEQSQ